MFEKLGCVKTCGWFDTTNDKLSGWVRITIQTSVSCGWTAHFLGLLAFFGPSIRWRITACPRIQKCFRSNCTIKNSLVDWFIDRLLMVILMLIDGYWWLLMLIDGYWLVSYWCLLMLIDGYWLVIDWLLIGYWWFWLLMVIVWLLMVIESPHPPLKAHFFPWINNELLLVMGWFTDRHSHSMTRSCAKEPCKTPV